MQTRQSNLVADTDRDSRIRTDVRDRMGSSNDVTEHGGRLAAVGAFEPLINRHPTSLAPGVHRRAGGRYFRAAQQR